MTDAELALRTEMESSLREESADHSTAVSGSAIEVALRSERDGTRQSDLVIAAMKLPEPGATRSVLIEFVAGTITRLSKSRQSKVGRPTLGEVYAATVLALLGDRSGIPILRSVGTLTNSQIEFFYARGALTLLREQIPPNLENQRSVFRWREDLIDACHQGAGTATDRRG